MNRIWTAGTLRIVFGAVGVLLLSALVWWVGPLIAVGEARPLDGVLSRGLLIGLIVAGWVGAVTYRAWRRRRLNAALLQGIAASSSAADREAELLGTRFQEAVAKLKAATRRGSRWGGGDVLYELPWYVFVGAPGSGKTTALLHAGLNFVLDENDRSVKGVGGTRNCDWWFTREAVLIDTAGRYATQDSEKEVDASAWDRFLQLLKKNRPRRPINGVLLTVSVPDLLSEGSAARAEQASQLRARLQELQAKLGIRPPVYVLVTKADLMAGFSETFDPIGKEARDQVWGMTFDAEATDPLPSFRTEFEGLQKRLTDGLVDRLQRERDPLKRAAIFGFPVEFAAVAPLLQDFLGQVFGRSDKLQAPIFLRGVYFTSGTQEGSPIDRLVGSMARTFGVDRPLARTAAQGRSYFLHRLLQDVIFRESHLVAFDAKAERRRSLQRAAAFACLALVSTVVIVGWAVSYARNKAYTEDVASRLPNLRETVDAVPPARAGDPLPLLAALQATRQAAASPDFNLLDPPGLNGLGLYQGDKLDAGARAAHRNLLLHALAPRIALRLEERLRASGKGNLEQTYEALKHYLMLYTPGHFDADALKAWITVDWDTQYRNLPAAQRNGLDAQLDALLTLGAPPAVAPLDAQLVAGVRDMLGSFPLEYRVYSRLKRQFAGELPEFTVAQSAGPNAALVFERASGEPLSRGVLGLYTKDGHDKLLQVALLKTTAQLASEEGWVLGRTTAMKTASSAVSGDLANRVRQLYFSDYIKAWDALLADVRLVRLASLDKSMDIARLLSSPDSPLAAFMRAAARETTLVPDPKNMGAADRLAQQAKNQMAKLTDPQPTGSDAGHPARVVDDHFASLHRLVAGAPAPIDEVGKSFGEVYAQLQAIDAAQKSKSPPPAGGGEKIKAVAAQQPEPIRSMLASLADAGARSGRAAERESLTGDLKPITDFCNRAIGNRYPFASGAKADVLPEDFGQLFGPGGMLDDFYQRRLAALVDTSTTPWSYKPLTDGTRPAAPAALADFQRASRIRDAFFRSGGRTPGFKLDLKADFPEVNKELTIEIDGQSHKFSAGSPQVVTVSWPSQRVASQIRLMVPGTEPLVFEGPWALFRMFDRFDVQFGAQPEKFVVWVNVEGRKARLDVVSNSVLSPFRMREMQQFRCPGSL